MYVLYIVYLIFVHIYANKRLFSLSLSLLLAFGTYEQSFRNTPIGHIRNTWVILISYSITNTFAYTYIYVICILFEPWN